ncbi:MAG: carboxypeptidase-like regulatory domain-containing protein [Candidatus Electrothrix scaldis]|nr:MAG: carboxypeptidase-like regulatory domain-containing protein [Candidatus Electrothrix sp. GW3-3]
METVNSLLKTWATEVLDSNVQVNNQFIPEPDIPSVVFFLHDLLPVAPSYRNKKAPLQLTLRYLVSTSAKDINVAHNILQKLAFAAMQHSEIELELSPTDPQVWLSLGVSARPGFWLSIIYSKDRDVHPMPLVTEAPELHLTPTIKFYGGVFSSEHLPLVGARVDLPNLNLSATTDSKGCFCFSAVPPQPTTQDVVVNYKKYLHRTSVSITHVPVEIFINKKEF